ncbi:MAG: MaoC family dehydratase [Crocinitomicaceae bacterium]|jgi:acyl dehydratase
MINIGDTFEHTFSFTQEDVISFAKVTGDNNPVHLDEVYAASTIFKRPIIHGMLGATVFSKVFGTMFPGEGTIYLNQNLQFLRPMLVNTNYTAHFEVLEIDREKHRATINTSVLNEDGKKVVDGSAILMHTEKF